jgi:hypothetical protein
VMPDEWREAGDILVVYLEAVAAELDERGVHVPERPGKIFRARE